MTTVSPSAIKEYSLCPRKWFYTSILGFRSPPNAAAAKGQEAHAELEAYYLRGELPTTPKLLDAIGLEDMPKYQPEGERTYKIEEWLPVRLPNGLTTRQRADLIDLADPKCPLIEDHKTSSTRDHFLNEYQLARDPQCLSYARAVVELFAPEATHVRLMQCQISWAQLDKPRTVAVTLSVANVIEQWTRLEQEVIANMLRDSKAASPADVEAKLNACEAFGGCPHLDRCQSALFVTCEPAREEELVPMPVKQPNLTADLDEPLEWSSPKTKPRAEVLNPAREKEGAQATEPALSFPIGILYVDCLPTGIAGGAVERLSDVLRDSMDELAKKTGVPDWRLHDYGKGKGYVAAALKKMAAEGRLPKALFVSTREDVSSVALEVLTPLAAQAIFGTR